MFWSVFHFFMTKKCSKIDWQQQKFNCWDFCLVTVFFSLRTMEKKIPLGAKESYFLPSVQLLIQLKNTNSYFSKDYPDLSREFFWKVHFSNFHIKRETAKIRWMCSSENFYGKLLIIIGNATASIFQLFEKLYNR